MQPSTALKGVSPIERFYSRAPLLTFVFLAVLILFCCSLVSALNYQPSQLSVCFLVIVPSIRVIAAMILLLDGSGFHETLSLMNLDLTSIEIQLLLFSPLSRFHGCLFLTLHPFLHYHNLLLVCLQWFLLYLRLRCCLL